VHRLTTILPATDNLYAFLLGEADHPALGLPPGGISPRPILEMLRQLMKPARAVHPRSDWAIVDGNEIVGLIGLKAPADAEGCVEIGYGIAESRWGRGHATAALALALKELGRDPKIATVTAENAVDNIASQRVLEKNGFVRTGTRIDSEDGEVVCWRV
jgi:RimJ/RimL family protein N-acetyltransferase